MEIAVLALGCFWGPEIKFSKVNGVVKTEVGYCGGNSAATTYKEVCTGTTNHAEVVKIDFDEKIISYEKILDIFFESHDPTQFNRQGNDVGAQYRSIILFSNEDHKKIITRIIAEYQTLLSNAGYGEITTAVKPIKEFYKAENYHQDYIAKNPNGYCNLKGTGCFL